MAIVSSLAGQAAVSIENGRLYQDIENLFAGFIKAAVTAIDRRDPGRDYYYLPSADSSRAESPTDVLDQAYAADLFQLAGQAAAVQIG